MSSRHELRVVLIGGRELGGIEASGKSSVGNTILGRNVFHTDRRTACCQIAEGQVHGFNIKLVDTPGWWWHYSVKDTPMFDQLEIIRSQALCTPGPHAFLLVIPVDSAFPNVYKIALEEHLEFCGEQIWNHMIVVFSSVAPFNSRAFENHVKNWPDLMWLLGKCNKRFHVIDITNQNDGSQVSSLLSTIATMVSNKNDNYFRIVHTEEYLKINENKRTRAKERAQKRVIAVQRQRDEMKAMMLGGAYHSNEIRLVIVGASWSGRSSAGNIILDTDAFEVDEDRTTVRCAVSYSEINGRKLTVVDTPGWYYNSPLKKTSEIDKLEIKHSVTLCPPGPHAFLLTVPIATAFNQSYQKAVEEHMSLFGEEIWDYTFVLFTRKDWLGDTSIEERIETDEPHLEWLIKKCGNRYYTVTNKNQLNSTQSTGLIEMIDEMVAGNKGGYYKIDSSLSNQLNEQLNTVQSRAKINRIKARKQRKVLQEVFKDPNYQLSEMRMVLLGGAKSGKSSTGNTILSKHLFQPAIKDFQTQMKSPTEKCIMHQRKVGQYQVSIVDTPGWSSSSLESAVHILQSTSLCPPGPHAFILVLSAREPFTNEDQQTLEALMKKFEDKVWRHTLLLFSHGSWLKDRSIEEYIECEGNGLEWLVNKCEGRYHMLDNYDWGDKSQVKDLLEKINEMVVRNRGQHFIPKQKKGLNIQGLFQRPKLLTEEEWRQREDELIQRMFKAFWRNFDADDGKIPNQWRRGSIDPAHMPSLSGDTMLEAGSDVIIQQHRKVSKWLIESQHWTEASSSGYETESTDSLIPHRRQAGSKDGAFIPSFSGDTISEAGSDVTIRPNLEVSEQVRESQHWTRASSSDSDNESTDSLILHRRWLGSKHGVFIPSLRGDAVSETGINPHSEYGTDAGSSGYDTESISMGNNDILELRYA